MPENKMTIGIVRLSVDENQTNRNQLIRHLRSLGEAGCDRLFYDIASRTATIAERPGLQEALALVETGVVERILIPDVERLTANQVVLEEVKAIARRHNCQILPGNLNIDLCSDIGGLLGSIAAAGATYELSRIRNRHDRGTGYEQERNIWRGAVRFGFVRRDGQIEPDTRPFLCILSTRKELHPAAIAKHQVDLFLQHRGSTRTVSIIHEHYGIALPAIVVRPVTKNSLTPEEVPTLQKRHFWAISIFRWSESGFINWVTDPVLAGGKVVKKQRIVEEKGERKKLILPKSEWVIAWDNHPGIISREAHEEILRIVSSHRSIGRGSNSYADQNWFKGLVYCAKCDSQCRLQGNGSKTLPKFAYQCCLYVKERHRRKLDPNAMVNCDNKTMTKTTDVEAAVVETLVAAAVEISSRASQETERNTDEPEAPEIVELRSQIRRYELMDDPDLESTIAAKQLKLSRLLASESAQKEQRRENEKMIIRSFRDAGFWHSLKPHEKQDFAQYLVKRIKVLGGKVVSVELN